MTKNSANLLFAGLLFVQQKVLWRARLAKPPHVALHKNLDDLASDACPALKSFPNSAAGGHVSAKSHRPKVEAAKPPVKGEGGWQFERLTWLRRALLVAAALTMLASAPLWLSTRVYPLLPIAGWWPVPQPPWDKIVFGAVLASLVLAVWRYRLGVICFLVGSLYLAFSDQARWQPWFYMYWVMLLLTLAPPSAALYSCRFAISAVYLWSGIHKCNADYFNIAVPWLAKAGAEWLPSFAITMLQGALAAAPVVEIFIGLAVWFQRTRRVAIAGSVAVHLTALLLLGPLGHKHNWIVWPWNLVMPILLMTLFPFHHSITPSLQSRWATLITSLFCLLPALNFFGWWDSYLSFALYSGKLTKADLFVSEEVRNRLPEAVKEFVVPTPPPYNEEIQGPYVVLVELWADKILRVPPLPEPRGYRAVARFITSYAADPNDVRLVLIPKIGPILFYRGSDLRPQAGMPLNL